MDPVHITWIRFFDDWKEFQKIFPKWWFFMVMIYHDGIRKKSQKLNKSKLTKG